MNLLLTILSVALATAVPIAVAYGLRNGWWSLLELRPVWAKRPPRKPGQHRPKPRGRVTSVPKHMTTVRIPLQHHDGPRRRP